MGDVDGGAGGGAVPSPGHCVHRDGVFGAGPQAADGGGGLGAGDGELFGGAVASWRVGEEEEGLGANSKN